MAGLNASKIRETLYMVVERFKTNDIPEAIALSMFPIPNIPARNWSLFNRILMVLAGTSDARGFKQWQAVGRKIKKGSKAIRILAPRIIKVKKEESSVKEDHDEKSVLAGFISVPVFRFEDTEGSPLDYEEIKLPELPFMDIAEKWGLETKAVPGNGRFYGCYRPNQREILLASPEESVLFHELAHAAHNRLKPLKKGQDWKQEIIAELSACVLSYLVGKKPVNLGHHYQYIEDYAKEAKKSPHKVCFEVISEVEEVLELVMSGGECKIKKVQKLKPVSFAVSI